MEGSLADSLQTPAVGLATGLRSMSEALDGLLPALRVLRFAGESPATTLVIHYRCQLHPVGAGSADA
jgi:hypothetical protein